MVLNRQKVMKGTCLRGNSPPPTKGQYTKLFQEGGNGKAHDKVHGRWGRL